MRDTSLAETFNPTANVKLDKDTPETPSSPHRWTCGIDKGDVNFAGVVLFIPNDWDGVKGSEIPVGAGVGSLDSTATLGALSRTAVQCQPVDMRCGCPAATHSLSKRRRGTLHQHRLGLPVRVWLRTTQSGIPAAHRRGDAGPTLIATFAHSHVHRTVEAKG